MTWEDEMKEKGVTYRLLFLRSANMLSSTARWFSSGLGMTAVVVALDSLAPPSNDFPGVTCDLSSTLKEGSAASCAFCSSSAAAVDFRLPNPTENLGI